VFADKQTTEWATLVETSHIYAMKPFLLTVIPTQRLILEAITSSSLIIPFIMTYASIFFSARIVNIWNSLPNSVVYASTINTFKMELDKFWLHQAIKHDFTADLTGTRNQPEFTK